MRAGFECFCITREGLLSTALVLKKKGDMYQVEDHLDQKIKWLTSNEAFETEKEARAFFVLREIGRFSALIKKETDRLAKLQAALDADLASLNSWNHLVKDV
jgi:hypothetical protein